MTRPQLTPPEGILVAINVAKARNEVLIEVPGLRRRRLSVLNVPSRRIQSRYRRRAADLPFGGRRVELQVVVRRFCCDAAACGRKIFAERFLDGVLPVFARRTSGLEQIVHHLGLALGGRPCAGLAQRLILPVSRDPLLRVVRRRAPTPSDPLDVIGIDDFAWRRNHRYGTLICDLERRRIVALLPSHEQATAQTWLKGYLCREEADVAIRALAEAGAPIRRIGQRRGLSRKVVRAVLRSERTDVFQVRQNSLEAYLPWLNAQWDAGSRNAAELWRMARTRGFRGSLHVIREWATRRRRAAQANIERLQRVPSARTLARLLTMGRDGLTKAEILTVAVVEGEVPALIEAREVVVSFHSRRYTTLRQPLRPAGARLHLGCGARSLHRPRRRSNTHPSTKEARSFGGTRALKTRCVHGTRRFDHTLR